VRIPFTNYEIRLRGPVNYSSDSGKAQIRDGFGSPMLDKFGGYVPNTFNLELYEVIRECIPFLDVAIIKLVRLIGDFEFETFGDKKLLEKLNNFRRTVPVNYLGVGLDDFLYQMSDAAFTFGFGVGEIVPTRSLREVERLKTSNSKYFKFKKKDNRLVLTQIFGVKEVEIEFNDNIFYLAFDCRNGHPQGYSLMYSLPFVSDIFARIEKSIENVWWRAGDPTFTTLVEGGDRTTSDQIKIAVDDLKDQMTNAMRARREGKVWDIYAGVPMGGKVLIDILGKDFKFPDLQQSARLMLEQIVGKTGLPPFMMGLSWSTTERMSKDQNDMIVADTQYRRQQLDPIMDEVIDQYLTLTGDAGKRWEKRWAPVNLLDVMESGRARYYEAFAAEKEIQNNLMLLDLGYITEEEFRENVHLNKGIQRFIWQKLGGNGKEETKKFIEIESRKYAKQMMRKFGVLAG